MIISYPTAPLESESYIPPKDVYYDYPDFTITLRAYDCMARNTDYKLLEHLDAKWLTREQLPQLKWTEADRLLVEKL